MTTHCCIHTCIATYKTELWVVCMYVWIVIECWKCYDYISNNTGYVGDILSWINMSLCNVTVIWLLVIQQNLIERLVEV